MNKPPWAKNTQKHVKEHGVFADYEAWKEWFISLDDNDFLADIETIDRASIYYIFCNCFPDYEWEEKE